jgi:hypothetical protein
MHRAANDPSEADPKAHDRGATTLAGDRDDVEVGVVVEHDALGARGPLESRETVARLGGGLVVLLGGGLVHLALQQVAQLPHVTFEEARPRRREFLIALGVDGAHAGSGALADVVEQTGPIDALLVVELVLRARPQGKGLEQFVHRHAQRPHVDEGPEVANALHVLAAGRVGRREGSS